MLARHSFTTAEQDVARHLWTKPAHNECSGQSEQLSLARLKQGSSNEGLGRGAGEKGGGGGRREGEGGRGGDRFYFSSHWLGSRRSPDTPLYA